MAKPCEEGVDTVGKMQVSTGDRRRVHLAKIKTQERYLGWAMAALHGLNSKPRGKRVTTVEKKGKNKMGVSFRIRSTEARMAAPAI